MNVLRGGSPRILGSLFNKSCDSAGLRHVNGMATLDLNDRRARPFGHSTLRVGWYHLVIGNNQVPTWLGLPRRFADLSAESRHAPRDLRVCHERSLFGLHVSRERGSKLRPI